MATVTLEYDARNAIARKTMDFVLSLGTFRVLKPMPQKRCGLDVAIDEIKQGKTNATTRKAIKEAKTGDVLRFNSADDLINCMYEL